MRYFLYLLLTVLTAATAFGSTITVRKDGTGDYAVIQHALDVAAAGDTILIGPGEYLEHSTIRFPAWSRDIESYANVTVDNLTIIGAGADKTIIGPELYSGDYSTESPKVVTYLGGNDIRISDLCVRNSHSGVFMQGKLFLERCTFDDNFIGLAWEAMGSGGWTRDCRFDVRTPSWPNAITVMNNGGASELLVEDCTVEHATTLVVGVPGVTFRDCFFANGATGMQIQTDSHVFIDGCRFSNFSTGGIHLTLGSGTICEVTNSEISGGQAAIAADATGSRFIVTDTRLEGGTYALMFADLNAGAFEISGCDFVKGSGPVIRCSAGGAAITHDLRNNYWGTTDEPTINSWIIDHNDNVSIGATVQFNPFAGQSMPIESANWGDLKALWR